MVIICADEAAGLARHPLVWSAGGLPKRRRVVGAVRSLWPYSVSALIKLAAFLGTLHWPSSGSDLGVGDVSYVELLILNELWAGERYHSLRRLFLAVSGLIAQFQCRLFHLDQALIVGGSASSFVPCFAR